MLSRLSTVDRSLASKSAIFFQSAISVLGVVAIIKLCVLANLEIIYNLLDNYTDPLGSSIDLL